MALTRHLSLVLLACAALALATRSARAAGDIAADAEALYEKAVTEDASGSYADAARHYRAAVARSPSFREAQRAATRAAVLEAHSEGGFAPYARLESVRRDPTRTGDAASIDALARDAEAFPPGLTRGEAWMVCADAFLARLHRRSDAETAFRRVTADTSADSLLRRQAAAELIRALLDDGALDAARDESITLGPLLDAGCHASIRTAARRRLLHRSSIADLAAFLALSVLAVARAASTRRRGVRRALERAAGFVAAFTVYTALVGGALASAYERGNATPFLAFGLALIPIAVLARAWGAAGSPSLAARSARAALCASAVVAAAFLILEAVDVQYLDGFNL